MLKLPSLSLEPELENQLSDLQRRVDQGATFEDRVNLAKSRFKSKPPALFVKIRQKLMALSGELVRCNYCEDSCADEVEHVNPKDFYPERVFVWENYVYACGPCSSGKSNKYAVWLSGAVVELNSHRRANGVVPPPAGDHLFIDPRSEDPLQYLWLDISAGTFRIVPLNEDNLEKEKASYTIEFLRLNREVLVRARENAYGGYRDRLSQYVKRRDEGAAASELESRRSDILRTPHGTVWEEMKRQKDIVPELTEMFQAVPEALQWSTVAVRRP